MARRKERRKKVGRIELIINNLFRMTRRKKRRKKVGRTEKRNGKQMIFIPRTPVTMKLNGTNPGLRRREDLPHPPLPHPRYPRGHVLHLRRRRGKPFPECKFFWNISIWSDNFERPKLIKGHVWFLLLPYKLMSDQRSSMHSLVKEDIGRTTLTNS